MLFFSFRWNSGSVINMLNFNIIQCILFYGLCLNLTDMVTTSSLTTKQCPFGCDCREPGVVKITGSLIEEIPTLPYNTLDFSYNLGRKQFLGKNEFIGKHCDGIKHLDLNRNGFQELQVGAFSPMKRLETLRLSMNSLQKIHSYMFLDNPFIKSLNINRNLFKVLPITTLCTLYNMESLRVGGNPLREFTWKDPCLGNLTNLKEISFSETNLRKLMRNDTFYGLRKLPIESVHLADCHLTTIPKMTLASLPHLKNLNMKNNRFMVITDLQLTYLTNLEGFGISGNILKTCDLKYLTVFKRLKHFQISCSKFSATENDFQYLAMHSQLESVTIANGNIFNISSDALKAFSKSTHLKNVTFQSMAIDNVGIGAFRWFRHVNNLSLKGANLTKHQMENALQGLSGSIVNLDLSENRHLSSITQKMFLQLKNIRSLRLKHCGIYGDMPTKQLSPLLNLEKLDLGGNLLSNIRPSEIQFPKVSTLLLNGNSIVDIYKSLFYSFPNLKYLNLSSNKIKVFVFNAYIGNYTKSLKTLLLSKCELKDVRHVDVFVNLESLHLEHNIIEVISIHMFNKLFNLKNLYLDNNAIVSLRPYTFQDLRSLVRLSLKNNHMQHIQPRVFFGLTNLRKLDLSNNRIMTLNLTTMKDLIFLEYLHIARNPLICTCDFLPLNRWLHVNNIFVKDYFMTNAIRCRYGTKEVNLMELPLTESDCNNIEVIIKLSGIYFGLCILMAIIAVVYRFRWYLRYEYFLLRTKVYRYREVNNSQSYIFDAFVSFSSHDYQWVLDELVQHVELEKQMKLCLYDRNWLIGRNIVDYIVESIDSSRHVVLIVTNQWAKSTWCSDEMYMARCVRSMPFIHVHCDSFKVL